ncbi:MAG: hypothetical protein Q7T51_01385 [Candidatus Moranbacteria bacterium]|nr:hypothetical protein [Candidatus Moranbacteria bacterium]
MTASTLKITSQTISSILSKHLQRRTTMTTTNIIDCDAIPYCPKGWEIEEHKKSGQFQWDIEKISLYTSAAQKHGMDVGNEIRKELESQSNLNACVLDYLLAHPEFIPEEWKHKAVYFWGTIYCSPDKALHVRYLYWNWIDDKQDYGFRWLNLSISPDRKAAILKKD